MNDVTARDAGTGSHGGLYRTWFLILLVLVYASSFLDRVIVAVVGQPLKLDMHLTDLQIGLFGGLAFSIFYSLLGLPIARLADRFHRVTLISISIIAYSAMTALCGTAGAYWQLILLRLGVGIGEAGGTPTAHSLISDLFGPRRRASALSIYALGPPIGVLAGALGGGWLLHVTGNWRWIFYVFGAPGLVIGILVWLTLREPRRGAADDVDTSASVPPVREVVKILRSSRAFIQMLLGVVIGAFVQYGINLFIPMYLARVYSMSYAKAGLIFGLVIGVGGIIGNLLGGLSADWASPRDHRWYAWVPAVGTLLGFPLMAGALWSGQWQVSVVLLFLATIVASMWNGPTFAVILGVVGLRMRATASALVFLLMNLVGQGLGPVAIGFLSDRIGASLFREGNFKAICTAPKAPHGATAALHGPLASACHAASANGVRYAMLTMSVILVWSAIHYFCAARHLRPGSSSR